ncbi:MAG TPA: DUF4157 domain-containing protein [Blastocatellia bacterium]|jgi:hypothetical protein
MSRHWDGEPEEKREKSESLELPATHPVIIQRSPGTGVTSPGDLQSSFGNAAIAQSLTQGEAAPARDATTTPAPGLIVEDTAEIVQPGQMKKSDFLAQLRGSVTSAADEILGGSVSSVGASLYIDQQFANYSVQSGQQVEQAARRYAPGARTASDYIAAITARLRQEMSGERKGGQTAAGVMGAAGEAMTTVGSMLFKEREGGARHGGDPLAIQFQLGRGQSLASDVKTRMEGAFGESFTGVEIHTGAKAAGLSSDLNARAFTVGEKIAFGAGEYQPGTLVGDALIAHELAHVVQQRSGGPSTSLAQKGASEHGTLEEDADQAAVGAVLSLWGGANQSLPQIQRKALPRLRSGLQLRRCSAKSSRTKEELTRAKDAIQELLGNPEINEVEIIKQIDALGGDAYTVLKATVPVVSERNVDILAASEAGQRILERISQALHDGDSQAEAQAKMIDLVLKRRRSTPQQQPSQGQQQDLNRINAAINAESKSRLEQYQDRKTLMVPLRLPVQLHQPGMEMSGGVYYDRTMPVIAPGDAGLTIQSGWSIEGAPGQKSYSYPMVHIRLGPLALMHSDDYLRSVLWHEFQHYRRINEFRQPDTSQSEESRTLEEEYRQPGGTAQHPNFEIEATSLQIAAYFDQVNDQELRSMLRYLADHMGNAKILTRFKDAAIERIRLVVKGDRKKQDRLINQIKALGSTDKAHLDDLRKAIQADLTPKAGTSQRRKKGP